MLGDAGHCEVQPGDFVWEPSRGALLDAVLGRRVIFLGRAQSSSPRDVYRAAVRVTLEGHPISVARVVNLSDSPFGDEQGLVGRGTHVAYATVAFGAVQQVTLLDLDGAPGMDGDGLVAGLMARLTNLQETGSMQGLGHMEVSANIKGQTAALSLGERALSVCVDGGRSRFGVDLRDGRLLAAQGMPQNGASSILVPPIRKPPIIWAVDTVRAVTGPEPIAWLEDKAFSARDLMRKAGYHAFGGEPSDQDKLRADSTQPPPPPAPARPVGPDGLAQDESWPPQHLRTIWEQPDPGEGEWRAPHRAFLKKNTVAGVSQQPPPYFMESFVRPDPERPYSKVLLVAMDTRQLQLGMEGGIEDPKPLTGARGEGRIPRDPATLSRTVGAFNGAFKTTHGEYGMMVNRRVLLPPKPGAATVMIQDDGRVGFGTWPQSTEIPQNMLSFRQNLEPLVDGQQLNPSNRKEWGWALHGTHMLTHRSGLCLTSTGQMVYAWGAEVTGETLGRAMIQAGCVYAIHLDMNPHHTAFAYLDVRNTATKDYDAELLTPEMEVMPDRFILWSPKDFFYLTLREEGPPDIDGWRFRAAQGAQPSPGWRPAIWSTRTTTGGATIRVDVVNPSRAAFWLGVGRGARLDAGDRGRVLAAIEFPLPEAGAQSGGGKGSHAAQDAVGPEAKLWVDAEGRLVLSAQSAGGGAAGLMLPVLKNGSVLSSRAKRTEARQDRSALCVDAGGRAWIARGQTSSYEPLVSTLSRTGCSLVVALDSSGAGGGARLHRTGTDDPPVDRYEHGALYVMARVAQPEAFAWKP